MKKSEIENLIYLLAEDLFIPQENIRIISSAGERKNCFKELNKPYYPLVPDTVCEAVPSFDYTNYFILVFPENILSKDSLKAEFIKIGKEITTAVNKLKEDNKNGKILLQILSDYINEISVNTYHVNSEICRLAKRHEITGIAYKITSDEQLKNFYYNALKNYAVRKNLIKKVKEALEKEDIEHFFVKGSVICEDYPTPELRTMGDIDIQVRQEDKIKTADILTSLGFNVKDTESTGEWKCLKNGFMFELHHALCYDGSNTDKKEKDFLLSVWNYVNNNELSKEFHFIYLLSHLKKHLTNCGVGFRQFLDIAVEIKYGNLDFDKLLQYSQEAGLKQFLLVCLALIERWFSIPVPYKADLTEDFIKNATFRVLNNGVFGYQNIHYEEKKYARYIKRNGVLKIYLTAIFLPYRDFIKLEEYSWLKGKPFLLPLAWAIRIIKNAKKSDTREHGIYTLNKIASVQNINTEFSEWGI